MIRGATVMIGRLRNLLTGRNTPRAAHLQLGESGERAATRYLVDYEGYAIVATNFRVPLGRGLRGEKLNAEIDVIAYDQDTLVFVEVKTRTSSALAGPERAVDLRKQRQIARAARRYRQLMKVIEEPYRYDVVTVQPGDGGEEIQLFRGYFDDRVFQKSRYFRDA